MNKILCIIIGILAALCGCAPSITITGNNNTVTTMTSTAGTFTIPLSAIPGV